LFASQGRAWLLKKVDAGGAGAAGKANTASGITMFRTV
jgi:hypothetical protein